MISITPPYCLLSLFYLIIPSQTSSLHFVFHFILILGPLSLALAFCVIRGLDLAPEAWWALQKEHN